MTPTGVLPAIKRYMENNDDGYGTDGLGRRVTMDELKALTPGDRDDFREMLGTVGVDTKPEAQAA